MRTPLIHFREKYQPRHNKNSAAHSENARQKASSKANEDNDPKFSLLGCLFYG
jgi:hypothetical protein